MRIPAALLLVAGAVIGSTLVGVSEAATSSPTLKACSDSKGALVLQSKGHCPKKTKAVKVGLTGPAGAPGQSGTPGLTGAAGSPGAPGTPGKNGADGPGALGTTLDNASNQLESTGVQAITGTDLFFDVECQPGVSASVDIKNPKADRLRATGTVFLDNASSTSSTWKAGTGTASSTPGTSFVKLDTSTAALDSTGRLLTINDQSGTIDVSTQLVLVQGYDAVLKDPSATITFTATVTPTACTAAAQVVPSSS